MLTFRTVAHPRLPGAQLVEILKDGNVVGVIYPDGDKGIKLVSAHIEDADAAVDPDFAGECVMDDGSEGWPPIPAVMVQFNPSPYKIVGHRLVKFPNDPRTS
jgi:hypothetical protein